MSFSSLKTSRFLVSGHSLAVFIEDHVEEKEKLAYQRHEEEKLLSTLVLAAYQEKKRAKQRFEWSSGRLYARFFGQVYPFFETGKNSLLISRIFVPWSTSLNIPNNGSLLIKVVARVSLVSRHNPPPLELAQRRSNASVVPHDETQKNRCPGYLHSSFQSIPIKRSTATRSIHRRGPLFVPWKFHSAVYLRPVLREQALPLGLSRKREASGAWRTDGGGTDRDGWAGYAGTGGRLTIVSGQEGGHRGPDTRPGNDRRADREGGRRRKEIDRGTIPCARPMRAMQFPAGPSVRLCGRACHLRHCSSPLFAYESEHSRDQDGI